MKLQLEDNLTFFPTEGPQPSPPGELFSCDLCPKTFLHLDALHSHARNHQLACLDCTKSFPDSAALARHQEEVHGQEKSFHCSQCDKSFKELRTLRLHLKIHNSEYPEHCEVCKKGFRTKWQLKQHLMDHGGKRPYPCPECTFTCKTKQQLNEHRRKHSGEKAYSCPLCGTRFTYRNGLIKHTKLNRCPKKIIAPEGDRLAKKKSKVMDQLGRQKFDIINTLDEKARSEKSLLDQKILDVIQKRSALKTGMVHDINNNGGQLVGPNGQLLGPNGQLVGPNGHLVGTNGTNGQLVGTNGQFVGPNGQHLLTKAQLIRELVPGQMDSPSSTTTTFLTNSTDISSWAATLPAGTKVTVTHYDASKKSGGGELVATPTHTETIIVTQPKDASQKPAVPVPILRNRPPPSLPHSPPPSLLDSLSSPHFPEYLAMNPNDLLLKAEGGPVKEEPVSPPCYSAPSSSCSPPSPSSDLQLQVRAQALLAAVRPDLCFDPNMKIKKEFEQFDSPMCTSSLASPSQQSCLSTNLNDIKKEVLSELFDDEPVEYNSSPLDRQLSVKSEQEEEIVSDDFYDISFKLEPIASPHSNSSTGESDHDSFSFHHDLDDIVNTFSKSNSSSSSNGSGTLLPRGEAPLSVADLLGRQAARMDIPQLPNLDLDFQNFFDDNIADVNMNDQDFFQMNMDTFDAASELVSNV